MLPGGAKLTADAEMDGWVRLEKAVGARRGWALVDGAEVGLGLLLHREST